MGQVDVRIQVFQSTSSVGKMRGSDLKTEFQPFREQLPGTADLRQTLRGTSEAAPYKGTPL